MFELSLNNGDDILEVTDIIERVEELREARDLSLDEWGEIIETLADCGELATLESFLMDLRGSVGEDEWEGGWYPSELIHEGYFEVYAQRVAEDEGVDTSSWPCQHIDWENAADSLKDYYEFINLQGEWYLAKRFSL